MIRTAIASSVLALAVLLTAGCGGRARLPAGALEPKESGYFPLRGACYRLGNDYLLSGQLAQPDLDIAKENGVKSVILVRLQRELGGLGYEPDQHVNSLGLHYVHFPVGPETISDAVADAFLETVGKAPKPVLIMGSNGNRVWGLWALYLGARWDVPVDRTKAVAQKHGIKKLVIEDFVRDYVSRK